MNKSLERTCQGTFGKVVFLHDMKRSSTTQRALSYALNSGVMF